MKKRVLVIDDDSVYRELLSIALTAEGYEACTAENGQIAQKLLLESRFDAIIVDMLMPMMDGLRFLHWIRKTAKLSVPALVLTSIDSRDVSVEALLAGAADVIVKPVSLPQLLKKLAAVTAAPAALPGLTDAISAAAALAPKPP